MLSGRQPGGHLLPVLSLTGSRPALRGEAVDATSPRILENVGRVFSLLVRALALPGLHAFTAAAACESFDAATLDGFSFDVEVLLIAHRRGLRIAEIPVTSRNDAATRVGTFKGFLAFLDLVRIRARTLAGRY